MDEIDRTTAVYLGALLLDGIIPSDLKIIEHTIHSLNRAALHIEMAKPYQERMARIRASALRHAEMDTAPGEMVETPQSLEPSAAPAKPPLKPAAITKPTFGQRPPKGPQSAALRRKEALEQSKLEPPYSPDDAS